MPQWVGMVEQEQHWARSDHLTILCAPAGESSVETAAGQRRLSYLDYNFRSSRVVCKGIPEEEHWRKQEDVVGKAISVSRKQQERTAGWVVHGEPLVIRTGTASERWTLIRRKGCFGLWRGQRSVAEADHEVLERKRVPGVEDKKSSREWAKAGVLEAAHQWGCAVWLGENVYCQINPLELWHILPWRPSSSSPSSPQSLFVDAGTY